MRATRIRARSRYCVSLKTDAFSPKVGKNEISNGHVCTASMQMRDTAYLQKRFIPLASYERVLLIARASLIKIINESSIPQISTSRSPVVGCFQPSRQKPRFPWSSLRDAPLQFSRSESRVSQGPRGNTGDTNTSITHRTRSELPTTERSIHSV